MKKILVVDDDPGITALLEKQIQSAGFQPLLESNGAAGMARMRCDLPDLVILDVMMPGLDGYSFLSEARSDENLRHIPLIVITAREELGEIFRTEGVAAFFPKPLNMGDLMSKVRMILGE